PSGRPRSSSSGRCRSRRAASVGSACAPSWSARRSASAGSYGDRMRRRSEASGAGKGEQSVPVSVDVVNEQLVIAAVCVDSGAADERLWRAGKVLFFARPRRGVWEVLPELYRRGLAYDPATVSQLSGGEVDVAYLEALVKERPARPPNLYHHVENL